MANSISGNCRIAGATITYSGAASGSVVADGSGNFTIPGLSDGGYFLTPSLTGYFFFPKVMNRTLVGADITNCLFDNVLIPFNIYTEQAYDSAYVADANPIDPGNWDTATTFNPLQTLNFTIRPSSPGGSCISLLDGFGDVTGDAYAFLHIVSMVDNSQLGLLNLCDIDVTNFYEIFLTRSGATLNFALDDGSGELASGSTSYVPNFTVRIEYIQGVLSAYINNVLLLSHATTDSTTGSSGIEMEPVSATSDDQAIDFAEGSITFVAPNFMISGNIGDIGGEQVNLTGTQTRSTNADGAGDYSFSGCVAGPYTITPVPPLGDNVFTPTQRGVTVSSADIPSVDFIFGPAPSQGFGGDLGFKEDFNF